MSGNYSSNYVHTLEQLIIRELLPVYERWHVEHNLTINAEKVPKDLLETLKRKKTVAALLKPPQKQS